MRVLFVCTGNTCRSPLAEGILRAAARARGIGVEAKSAGVASYPGLPISQHSAAILEEKGLSADGMRSQQVTEELVRWADLILTMTMGHKEALIRKFPFAMEKTHTLIEYAHAGDEAYDRLVAEREKLAVELQIKRSMGQEVTPEEQTRLREIGRRLPGTDIVDPIGGPLEAYRRTAREIEDAINKWLDRLVAERDAGRPDGVTDVPSADDGKTGGGEQTDGSGVSGESDDGQPGQSAAGGSGEPGDAAGGAAGGKPDGGPDGNPDGAAG
jgi:protein-tyrosine phosphatase